MEQNAGFAWTRVLLAAMGAVLAPIVALVGILIVYGMLRQPGWLTPQEFAPVAGAWVGPIGGFLATLLLSFWTARRAGARPIQHGMAVGGLSALLDYVVGIHLLGAPFQAFYLIFYGGRVVAGLLGGWLSVSSLQTNRRLVVACPPEILWRCLTDPSILKQWITQLVEEKFDDPAHGGLGARSTILLREGNKIVAYRSVVTAWEPKHCLAIRLSEGSFAPGMEMDVRYELAGDLGSRTLLDYGVIVPMKGVFKLLYPLIWLGSVASAKKDLAKLQRVAASLNS
jgi:hypothetical protein